MNPIELFASGFLKVILSIIAIAFLLAPVWVMLFFIYLEEKGKTWVNSPFVALTWLLLSGCWFGGILSIIAGS